MSSSKVLKLAEKIEEKYEIDPDVVIHEHEGVDPVSYMADSNLKNIISDASDLLEIMNNKDDLPQWADEALAIAKANVNKILNYVRSEKIKTASKKNKCSECDDIHCCMNYASTHEYDENGDSNEAKCTGYKKAPVGSPKQRAFCKRHCGMKKKLTSKEVAKDPDSCINKGLRRWKCRCS